jgi:hypothetical protein
MLSSQYSGAFSHPPSVSVVELQRLNEVAPKVGLEPFRTRKYCILRAFQAQFGLTQQNYSQLVYHFLLTVLLTVAFRPTASFGVQRYEVDPPV